MVLNMFLKLYYRGENSGQVVLVSGFNGSTMITIIKYGIGAAEET